MPTCYAQSRPYVPRHWPRLPFAAALVAVALVGGTLGFTRAAQAATITVNTTTDEFNTGPNCSLREAIQAANTDTAVGGCTAGSGADTITLPSGTYQITISPGPDENANVAGDFDIASSLTIQGAGAGSTFVDGGGVDRVFDVAPNAGPAIIVGFSGLTLQNGRGLGTNFGVGGGMFINSNATVTIDSSTLANNQSTTGTGGAIQNLGTLTLNTVTLQNNTALSLGGAINSIGMLTVNGSTFTLNQAERGGALHINTDNGKTATITGSRFSSNRTLATAGGAGDDGGAIAIDTDGAANISGSTFTGNVAAGNGGAVYLNDNATQAAVGTLTLGYNRIVGNTAAGGSGLYRASGTATAERNWWGCNSGPAAAPCDLVTGAADFTPWIVLSHTASPSTIGTGQAATLSAGFLKNSDGSTNGAGDLGAFAGVPVTFGSAVLGTISGAQTSIQANGEATATYTAGNTPGAGSAAATVDNATATASLTINRPTTTVVSINRSGTSPTNAASIAWTVTFADAISGLSTGNFGLAATGLSGSSIANVSGSGTSWTVTANTGTGVGSLGLNLANDTGLDKGLSNLPFTGEVYEVDTAPPDTTITAYPANPSPSAAAAFSFVGTDTGSGVAGFQCSLDNAAFVGCTNPQSYSNLADGSHTFQVSAVDSLGNVDPTPASYAWVIDSSPPDTTIDSQPANPSNSSSAIFAFSGSDSGSGVASFECSLDSSAFAACANPQSYSNLTDGSHTFQVRAVDYVGIADPTPAMFMWTIDTTAPAVSINQAASQADPSAASPIHFTAVFNEPVAGFGDSAADVTLGGTAGATTVLVTQIAPNDGTTYDVAVSGMTTNGTVIASIPAGAAGDAVGNLNAASSSTDNTVSFIADGTPPDTTITSSPSNPSNDTSPSFSFTGSDDQTPVANLAFQCALDGNAFLSCTSPQGYGSLADGSHTFQVRAIDSVLNIDPTPASFTWTIDTTPPAVTINQAAGQADPTLASPINFTVVFNEPVTGFENSDVTLSGLAGATTAVVTGGPQTYNVAVSGMTTDGTVIASIPAGAATDGAGNGNTASTSTDNTVTFNFNLAPAATVSSGQCSSTNMASGTINLTLADSDGDPLTLTVGSNSNTTLVPNNNIVLGGTGNNRTLAVTAAPKKSGTATLTFNLSDGTVTVPLVITVKVGTDKKETINGTSIADMIFGLNGDDTINAGDGNDLVCGGNGKGVISGGSGDDTLDGANGDDTLRGQAGNDILRGGSGNDRLEGGDNNDTLTGNSGADFFSGGPGTDSATDFKPAEGDTQDGTLEVLSASANSLSGDPAATGGDDLNPSEDLNPTEEDIQAETQEPDDPGAVELTEQLYLPIVSQ